MADTLLVVIFSIVPTAQIGAYRWPVLMILVFILILFLQILALIFSTPPECKVRKKEKMGAMAVQFMLVLIGGLLFLRPFQERAVDQGGGLLEPNLFSFDFSQFLHLESEISTNDDLVFIVKKDPEDPHILLRRYVLSGYNSKQGFFRYETVDEKTHPQRLPDRKTSLPGQESSRAYRVTEQEYYLVNFDASAFIGMNEPVLITPFENWDASSFSAAYAVQSHTSEAMSYELFDSVRVHPSPQDLGLSPEVYALYTDYGKDERIAVLAQKITEGIGNYTDKVEQIFKYLKNGAYRYSLKPGIAPEGDQLSYFLFQSKKGYCSYFAFSMALLLRSLGIPTRVAAGFFIDPGTNTFNYYPVRSDMAHAWVEVCYPGYGWIEYDPTTQILAEGEEFRFSSGVPQLFERLMKEILDHHARLTSKEGTDTEKPAGEFALLGEYISRFMQDYWTILFITFLSIAFIGIHTRYLFGVLLHRNPRKKAKCLWSHAKRRLSLGGYKKGVQEAEAEWAKNLDRCILGVYGLYQGVAAARYAPEYTLEQFKALERDYKDFARHYAKKLSLQRRIILWLLPPLALILGPSKQKPHPSGKSIGKAAGIGLILLFALSGDKIKAQNSEAELLDRDAQTLYDKALESEIVEYWERAIDLYTKGIEQYPEDPRFPWALGNLYYHRRLYGLAWDYYRRVEALLPNTIDVLYQLSWTAAHLNNDTLAAAYLERILTIDPDNKEAISNLGWIYYKLHRLGESRQLLLSALERFGPDPDFAMTLGTIYTDLFRYEDAKKWYLEAIALGESLGKRSFTAVTHYNLSILETRFYHYDLAFEETNASLRDENRSSGRLARGGLFFRRLEFKQAFSDYQAAYEIDTGPLSKFHLAQSYQMAGHLEEARIYAEDCLREGDLSWMLNYRIDPVRYKRELHEILYKVYAGFEQTEYHIPSGTWRDGIKGMLRRISYRFKKEMHLQLFRKYSLLSADVFKTDRSAGGESNLDALNHYYDAFEAYPRRALTYLHKARDFEVPLIPESEAAYAYEEGRLLKDWNLLNEILPRFDPVWERDMIAKIYTELAKMKGIGKSEAARDAAERLYGLNRGGLRQQGITLPVELNIDASKVAPGKASWIEKAILREVKAAGIDPIQGDKAESSRFRLNINISIQGFGYVASCELDDRNQRIFSRSIPLRFLSTPEISAFARTLGNLVFINE
jgi:tetratricopeptide (TPR) repeat protein